MPAVINLWHKFIQLRSLERTIKSCVFCWEIALEPKKLFTISCISRKRPSTLSYRQIQICWWA